MLTTNADPECDVCLDGRIHRPATTKSKHPDFAGYELCEECARELNRRKPTYPSTEYEPEISDAKFEQ